MPGAVDDHQTANASALVQAGGAWLIPQAEIGTLCDRIAALLDAPAMLAAAGLAAAAEARPYAAERLADAVLACSRVTP